MEVTFYKKCPEGHSTIAYFSLSIPKWRMTINNLRLMRNKNGHTFIALPCHQYEKDGETKYLPYISFDKEVTERFQQAAKDALNDYVRKNGVEEKRDESVPF